VNRYAQPSSGDIVERELDSRFCVRVALDNRIHARVQVDHVTEFNALDGGREIVFDDGPDDERGLAEIASELAAPIFERGRLAPAGSSVGVGDAGENVAADRLREPRPLVLATRRQLDQNCLDGLDRRHGLSLRSHHPRCDHKESVRVVCHTSAMLDNPWTGIRMVARDLTPSRRPM
jgi:hypothetical protein